jgi:uncharacterized membrane protein
MANVDFAAAPAFRRAAPKPRMTIYLALLIIALVAMLLACLFMYLEIRRFGGFGSVQGRVSAHERPIQNMIAAVSESQTLSGLAA